jgi:hypothetical protein
VNIRIIVFLVLTLSLGASVTFEQTAQTPVSKVDIDAVIQRLVAAHDPVAVTRQVTVNVPYKDCYRVGTRSGALGREVCNSKSMAVQQPQTTQERLTISDLRFVSPTMKFGDVAETTLPDQLIAASQDVCNPNQTTGSQGASFSQQIQHTESETLTHTVTTSISVQVGAQIKLSDAVTLTNQITFGNQDAQATANLVGTALTQTLQLQVTQSIPANSRYALMFFVTPIQYSVPFSVTAVVDGKLSQNDDGLTTLSQIVGESARTFTVEGTVSTTLGLRGHTVFKQLEFDPTECPAPSSGGLVVRPLVLKPNQKVISKDDH